MNPFSGEAFLRSLMSNNPTEAMGQVLTELTWTVPGDPKFGGGHYKGLEEIVQFGQIVDGLFPDGLKITSCREWSALPSVSIVEAVMEGQSKGGEFYRNNYVFVFELDEIGLKVKAIREYADTAYSDRILASSVEGSKAE